MLCWTYVNGRFRLVNGWQIDTDVFTLQADLCKNLHFNYTHKKYLGSIVQAGIYGFEIKFQDYPDLNFSTGFEKLKEEYVGFSD